MVDIWMTEGEELAAGRVKSLCTGVFFFFQAEDGIRDVAVTGVQTCALPISCGNCARDVAARFSEDSTAGGAHPVAGRRAARVGGISGGFVGESRETAHAAG